MATDPADAVRKLTVHIKRYNPETDQAPHWEQYQLEADPHDRVLDVLLKVEPILGLEVIKDLVVDMKPFFDHYKSVMPFLVNDDPAPTTERLQSPEQRARYDETTKCILCACCTTACPPFWGDRKYVGPAAIVNAHRFIFDSRDRAAADRLEILNDAEGVWRCRTVFNCTSACPRDIHVTQAISEVKRALVTGSIDEPVGAGAEAVGA
jgi:succinate dehydrogenase / fumarate reductase iron-sulfur subunit